MTPNKKYTIPTENPLPDGHYCFPVYIPAEGAYLERFFWALDFFAKWVAWEETTGDMAKAVADRWKVANELTRTSFNEGGCSAVPQFRINDDCLLEVDCSGDGTDWKPVFTTDYDPTTDAPTPVLYPDPPPEGESNECLAAENITSWMRDGTHQFAILLSDYDVIGQIAALLYTLLSQAVSIVQSQLWFTLLQVDWGSFDAEEIIDDWTDFDWDSFKNLIVCYFSPDGSISPARHLEALDEMESHGGQIWRLIRLVWSLAGSIGISLLGKWAGITDGDCDSCDPDCAGVLVDFATGTHGTYAITGGSGPTAQYVNPEGSYLWANVFFSGGGGANEQRIQVDFGGTYHITTLKLHFAAKPAGVDFYYNNTLVSLTSEGGGWWSYTPDADTDHIRTDLYLVAGEPVAIWVDKWCVEYEGDPPPFG